MLRKNTKAFPYKL